MTKFARMFAVACAAALMAGGSEAAPRHDRVFVLWDSFLRLPAMCYHLDDGWYGQGWVGWDMRSDNKLWASTILTAPDKHMLVQESGPMQTFHGVLTPQLLAAFQDPNILAQVLADEINGSIAIQGLGGFQAVAGEFNQHAPPIARLMGQAAATSSSLAHVSVFGFVGHFYCTYLGERCEARYRVAYFVNISAVANPNIPKLCSFTRFAPTLVIAPIGKLVDAERIGGKMLGSAFINNVWSVKRDRAFVALTQGTIKGRNEGWLSWRQTQAATAEMLERIRQSRSEQIREVKTVYNPLDPGSKIERPAFIENAWLNASQDKMLLSDQSLEPNIIRGLMEQGEWVAIE